MKDLKILSRVNALAFFKNDEKSLEYSLILLRDPHDNYLVDAVKSSCKKDYLELCFDDVEFENNYINSPKKEHIEQALTWSIGKEYLIVACLAGVSRSSALAYSLLCARRGHEKAMEILDEKIHRPNLLIVKYAAELLGNSQMFVEAKKFVEKVDNAYSF